MAEAASDTSRIEGDGSGSRSIEYAQCDLADIKPNETGWRIVITLGEPEQDQLNQLSDETMLRRLEVRGYFKIEKRKGRVGPQIILTSAENCSQAVFPEDFFPILQEYEVVCSKKKLTSNPAQQGLVGSAPEIVPPEAPRTLAAVMAISSHMGGNIAASVPPVAPQKKTEAARSVETANISFPFTVTIPNGKGVSQSLTRIQERLVTKGFLFVFVPNKMREQAVWSITITKKNQNSKLDEYVLGVINKLSELAIR